MPQYRYHCNSCNKDWEEFHSIKETPLMCPFCEAASFQRIPSIVTIKRAEESQPSKQTGQTVKQYIEENKQVLKEYKQELKSKEL